MAGKILEETAAVRALARAARRVAVLGIKTEAQADQPAFYVPAYLARAGIEVVPVPVYYPEARTILDRPVFRSVADVPGTLDVVVVFRRPGDLGAHVPDLVAARPRAVWMQSGIRHDEVARTLAAAGIDVVMDRCIMVEHRAGG